MISISTLEFRYYVVIIITREFGKTLNYKGLRQFRKSAFNKLLRLKQVCGFQTSISIARFLRFVFYVVNISDQGCLGMYSQSNLLDRMLGLDSYEPCPQDFTNI